MFGALLVLAQLSSSIAGYDEAKALADKHEASLPAALSHKLLGSQGQAINRAFPACTAPEPPLPAFTVVLALDSSGKVQQTWRKGDSEFAKCVEREFAAITFFQPPSAPFFTSLEFSFGP